MQEIFKMTPHDKQVMMFSATLSKEIRPVCKKFMQDVHSVNHFLLVNSMIFLFTLNSVQFFFNYNFRHRFVGGGENYILNLGLI